MTTARPNPIIVVQGATGADEIPGFDALPSGLEVRYAPDDSGLAAALPGADVLFGWDFRGDGLSRYWDKADQLRWIQWAGAGVDRALFDDLVASDVTLTNARGVFDRPMAEYALGLALAHVKGFPRVFADQRDHRWTFAYNELLIGRQVLIVGVGSIGRAMARMFRAVGLSVAGVGRTARSDDPDFDTIHAIDDLLSVLPSADIVIAITPYTAETENLFDAPAFEAMSPSALFMNFGRGALVDEGALIAALHGGIIGGAVTDVARTEPLPADDPLWSAPNMIITPHVSGDHHGSLKELTALFLNNLERYRRGTPLQNIVDKHAGFVSA